MVLDYGIIILKKTKKIEPKRFGNSFKKTDGSKYLFKLILIKIK